MQQHIASILLDSIGILLMFVLLFSTRHTAKNVAYDHRLYHQMMGMTLTLNVLDLVAQLMRPCNDMLIWILLVVICSTEHVLQLVTAYKWTLYVDYRTHRSASRLRGTYGLLLVVPCIVVSLLMVINPFTHTFFTISPSGDYLPTDAVYFLHGLSAVYVLYSLLLPLMQRHFSWRAYVDFPVALFLAPVLIGNVLHLMLVDISVSWIAMAVGFVCLQLTLQNDIGYLDPLTGLYNRHFLNQHMQNMFTRMEEPENTKLLAGILIDMDGFKQLNDNFGHLVGDLALQDVGMILRESLPIDAVACRFGGDEFVVIAPLDKREEAAKMVESICTHLDKHNQSGLRAYQIQMSIGWTLYARHADTLDSFLGRMDEKMYRQKELHHEQMRAEALRQKTN